jgi:hypothetical protein
MLYQNQFLFTRLFVMKAMKSSVSPARSVKEKKKQGNVVPASLPPMAGFSQLSVPSLAQSSHLEQAHSPNIIIPSAPVAAPQRRQLQARCFKLLDSQGLSHRAQLWECGHLPLNP